MHTDTHSTTHLLKQPTNHPPTQLKLKLKNIYSTLIVQCIYIHITFKIKIFDISMNNLIMGQEDSH